MLHLIFSNTSFCKFMLQILIICCIPGSGDIAENKNTCPWGIDILIYSLMKTKDLCLRKMQYTQNTALFWRFTCHIRSLLFLVAAVYFLVLFCFVFLSFSLYTLKSTNVKCTALWNHHPHQDLEHFQDPSWPSLALL